MMKRNNLYIISLFLIIMVSCRDEMMNFNGKDSIYFKVQPATITQSGDPEIWPTVDTSKVPLIKTLKEDSTYMVKVRLVGYLKDYNRTFGIEIAETSTAREGVDFAPLNKTYTILANERETFIPITFYKTDEMKINDLYLTLNLIPTEDLDVQLNTWEVDFDQNSIKPNGKYPKVDVHTIIVSNKAYKPTIWFDSFAGPYYDCKILLICEVYNLTIGEFDSKQTMSNAKFKSIMIAFKNYLLLRQQEGDPVYLTDVNGEYILNDKGEKQLMTVGSNI